MGMCASRPFPRERKFRSSVRAHPHANVHSCPGRIVLIWSRLKKAVGNPRKMVALEPPIRAELFSVERLEQHAESLAGAQRLSPRLRSGRLLTPRLYDNTKVLIETYRAIVRATFEH